VLPRTDIIRFVTFGAFCGHSIWGKTMRWSDINQLCDIVRETAFAIHCYHRNGNLEKIYENALAHRLRKQGIKALQQQPLIVYDEDGTILGEYFADLLIEDSLVVELKAVRQIIDEHIAQILGYLKSTRIETGLLINFGSPKLFVKKYLMSTEPGQQPFDAT
jgi:GxxExxY protein